MRFRELARAIEQIRPKNLLVIGCGNGYLESTLSDMISILSVDIKDEELEVARALNKGKYNREFTNISLYDLPAIIEPGRFEAVVLSELLEHLEDDVGALKVAHHCLAPEGTLFVTVPNIHRFQNLFRQCLGRSPKYMSKSHIREYTLEDGVAMVENAGFSCQRTAGLDFWLPKDQLTRFVLPVGSPIRRRIASTRPNLATWYLLVCSTQG